MILVLLTGACSAAEPNGWSFGLFLGEVGAGAGAGVLTGIGFALIRAAFYEGQTNDYLMDDVFYFVLVGYGLGAAAGTIIIGEGFGANTENKAATYLGTIGGGLGTAGLLTGITALLENNYNDDAASIVAYSSLVATPVAAAVVYNLLKKPENKGGAANGSEFKFRPTTGYFEDSNGKLVPTYGIEFGF